VGLVGGIVSAQRRFHTQGFVHLASLYQVEIQLEILRKSGRSRRQTFVILSFLRELVRDGDGVSDCGKK
jgi:hypothetical protein